MSKKSTTVQSVREIFGTGSSIRASSVHGGRHHVLVAIMALLVYERRFGCVGVTKSPQLDVRKASVGGRQRGGMVEPELGPELFVKG